jgi:hypothetical protein
MFALQLVNFDFLYNINNFFRVEMVADDSRSNSFVFTMLPIHYHRNCGFMWEPGAFAAILALTLYINTFKLGDNILSRRNIIFIVALLTTQSTMGVLSLMIPVGLVLRDIVLKNRTYQQLSVVIIPTVIIVFALVFTKVDFLYAKMVKEVVGIEEEIEFVEKAKKDNFMVGTTRLASVILDIQSIKQNPYLGLGVDYQTVSADKLATNELTETACGVTALMVRFGVVGLLIYAFMFYRSASFERTVHRIGWVSLLFFILFSNELSASAFIHLFVF